VETLDQLDEIEDELNARSFLFVNPSSFRDGVAAATRAMRDMLRTADRREGRTGS
jgi:hypothetical protein